MSPGDATVKLDGADKLRSTLRRAVTELGDLTTVHRAAATTALPGAVAAAPRRSGLLAASGAVSADPAGGAVEFRTVYAGVINYGWAARNITANPFATRAVEAAEPRIITEYLTGTQTILDRVKGR